MELRSPICCEAFAYNFQSPQDEQMLFAILEKKVAFFPESFTACDRLASAYHFRGKSDLALKYFRNALELDPANRNAIRMIEELRR